MEYEYENEILDKSFRFAVQVVEAYKIVSKNGKEKLLSKKLLRAGTQVGNQLQMAVDSETAKERYDRTRIAFRFSREAKYWVKLLVESEFLELDMGQRMFNAAVEMNILIKDALDTQRAVRDRE
jgi:four helix bundle protein